LDKKYFYYTILIMSKQNHTLAEKRLEERSVRRQKKGRAAVKVDSANLKKLSRLIAKKA